MSEHGTGAKIAMDLEQFEAAICLSAMASKLDTLTDHEWCSFITRAWKEACKLAPKPKRKVPSPVASTGYEDPDQLQRYSERLPRGGG